MSYPNTEDFLAHYGVKGMKWGVRKDGSAGSSRPRGAIRRGLTKAGVSSDASSKVLRDGTKELLFVSLAEQNRVESSTRNRVLAEAIKLNQEPRFKGKDLKTDAKLKKAYHDELVKKGVDIFKDEIKTARINAGVEIADGLMNLAEGLMSSRGDRLTVRANKNKLRHADEEMETLLVLDFELNSLGHVIDAKITHSTVDVELFLAHYGVKGMKWGVRKDRSKSTGPSSDDHVRSRQMQKKTLAELSSKDLRELNDRLTLEQNFKRLNAKTSLVNKGASYIEKTVKVGETGVKLYNMYNSPAGKAARQGIVSIIDAHIKKR